MDTQNYKIRDIPDGKLRQYKATTGHGSMFTLAYKPTLIIETTVTEVEQGDMLLSGFSRLLGKSISLAGISYPPSVGNYLLMRNLPEQDDYNPDDYYELITELEELEHEQ